MSYILSGDAAVYYEEYGTGEPLVLLPGLLGSIDTHWRRFLPEYARHFHTIAVDLRGQGRTNNPSRALSLPRYIADLHTLLDTLEIERCFLCGYGLGGYVALAYALHRPGKIRAMAIHATRFYWTEATATGAARSCDPEVAVSDAPEWTTMLEKDHQPGNGPDGWRDLMNAARPFLRALPAEGIPESALSGLRCPVLVSQCNDDDTVPLSETKRLVAALPAGHFHLLEGCRHHMQSVPKQPFVELTVEFFRRSARSAAG
jgi:pimeloyl-ACP methyl ester carboxylesterase